VVRSLVGSTVTAFRFGAPTQAVLPFSFSPHTLDLKRMK